MFFATGTDSPVREASDVLRLIDEFRGRGLYVGSVVITQYSGQHSAAERRDNGVAVNIYGEQDLKIFESGVAYFK